MDSKGLTKVCPDCAGAGVILAIPDQPTCPNCDGSGYVETIGVCPVRGGSKEELINELDNYIRKYDAPKTRDVWGILSRVSGVLKSQAAGVAQKRNRDADRERFPDPMFNKWLDEAITDNGEYSVWDQVGDACAAWHGWDNRQYYAPVTSAGKYAEVLVPFFAMMENELHANAGKGDRPGWLQMDRKTALLEIYYHLGKLQKAAKDNDTTGIVEYAADVANMAMMLVDVCGLLAGPFTAVSPRDPVPEKLAEAMRVTIDERAREIERLRLNIAEYNEHERCYQSELAALKAKPGGVVLPERRPEVAGTWGDMGDAYNAGVNDTLDEVARLNSSHVSAGGVDERAAQCDHQWTDDGQFLLVCTSCGAQEDHDPHWRDMATAPRDGTMVRLLVEFTEHATDDADQAPTIGANNFDNDGEDRWQFAGWCWSHDHFTEGKGEPVGWLPMIEARATLTASAPNHSEQVRHMVPEGFRVMKPTSSIVRPGERWEIYAPCGSGGIVHEDDVTDWVVRKLLDAAAAPSAGSQGGDV